jgi:hypothetical protein
MVPSARLATNHGRPASRSALPHGLTFPNTAPEAFLAYRAWRVHPQPHRIKRVWQYTGVINLVVQLYRLTRRLAGYCERNSSFAAVTTLPSTHRDTPTTLVGGMTDFRPRLKSMNPWLAKLPATTQQTGASFNGPSHSSWPTQITYTFSGAAFWPHLSPPSQMQSKQPNGPGGDEP